MLGSWGCTGRCFRTASYMKQAIEQDEARYQISWSRVAVTFESASKPLAASIL